MQRLFSATMSFFRENQPMPVRQWTGAVRHTAGWMAANLTCKKFYPNPNFQKSTLLSLSEEKSEKKSSALSVAVYCVHGTADRFNAFEDVVKKILPNLPEEVSGVRMVEFKGRAQGLSIEEFGEQLAQQVIDNGDKNTFFMGHSRGTQVIEVAVKKLQARGINVHGIAAVGGPYGGSWLAVKPMTFISSSVAEMQPESKFLKEVRENVKQSMTPRFYYAAEADHIVMKDDVSIPEHKGTVSVLEQEGHLSVLSSDRLARGILRNIKKTVSPDYVEEGGIELAVFPAKAPGNVEVNFDNGEEFEMVEMPIDDESFVMVDMPLSVTDDVSQLGESERVRVRP